MRFTPSNSKPALYSLTALAAALLLFLILLPNSDSTRAQSLITSTPTSVSLAYSAMDAGEQHTCALRPNGAAVCWGSNLYGQLTPPQDETFASISSGGNHTCALRPNGAAVCWGKNENGQSSPPQGITFSSIAAATDHTCGIIKGDSNQGSLTCWGSFVLRPPPQPRYGLPSGYLYTSLYPGYNNSCGITQYQGYVCWGTPYLYYRVDNSGYPWARPGYVSINPGSDHVCGLHKTGSVRCWDNTNIGITGKLPQSMPPQGETFASLIAGGFHTCGLRANGTVACWGRSSEGQSTPPQGAFASISAGKYHTCGLRANGTVECWGSNQDGRSTPPTSISSTATPALTPTSVSATATSTATHTPTATDTPTPTNTPTVTGTPPTATPTATGTPPTATPTITPTVARDDSGAPIPTPTLTPTTTTRADVPTPTPTRTATTVTTSGNANARISQLESQVGTLRNQVTSQQEQIETQKGQIETQREQIQTQRGFIDSLRDLIRALTARLDALDGGSDGAPPPTPTPTPTHTATATATNTPVTVLDGTPTATPTSTTIPTATPTSASRSTLNPGCIGKIGLGWLTGTWNADCQSTKTPPTAKEGTRYARYYAFTLDAPSRITVTISSTDVRDTYLYLLRGSGNQGEIVNRGTSEIVEQLEVGTYTIEATTYNLETTGNFTLTLDIAATGVSAAAGAPR